MTQAEAEAERAAGIQKAIDAIFADGRKPHAIILIADYGPGKDLVSTSCVGSRVQLEALLQVGAFQLLAILEQNDRNMKLN